MLCKLAIFDLDGTILNTVQDLTNSVNAALTQSGFPERSLEEVRGFVGNGIRKTAHYSIHNADATCPYPGIPELLSALKQVGILTAVVSNKADAAVQSLCTRFFPGQFNITLGERTGVPRKPAPDGVLTVLKTLGIAPEDAVYIGDSEVDIQTARNA